MLVKTEFQNNTYDLQVIFNTAVELFVKNYEPADNVIKIRRRYGKFPIAVKPFSRKE